jgi:glutathione synthase/RimK-type ligase-like ATP-grasp enzyme
VSGLARLAVLYEHPEWFQPLFEELRRRGREFEPWRAESLLLDPRRSQWPELVVNRMSTSAHWRGHGAGQFAVLELLELLEARGVAVFNGSAAYRTDISKIRQAEVFRRAGVRAPATVAVNHPAQVEAAAVAVGFPVMVKPNCGGAGSGVYRFENVAELRAALASLQWGCDNLVVVQQSIGWPELLRTEVIDGEVLYAVRIERPEGLYELCPADACAAGARFTPVRLSREIELAVLAVARAARLDAGGIECFVDPRTGEGVFYDINALSNFITGARELLGFDPMVKFVDALERRLRAVRW